MDYEEKVNQLAKDQDGIKQGLAAVASALETQNSYMAHMIRKQEEEDEKKKVEEGMKEEEEKEEKMVKRLIKALEVSYPHVFKGDVAGSGADSEEKPAELPKPQEDQEPIQNQDNKEEDKKEEEEVEKQEEDEKDNEIPKDEKDEEIEGMKKELEDLKKNFDTAVNDAVEQRMGRAGWREVNGLNSPKSTTVKSLGTDENYILKGDESQEEVVEKLSKKSYRDIRKLQEQCEGSNNPMALPGTWNFDSNK